MDLKPHYSLEQIAAFINAKFIGDSQFVISGINEIHCVRKGDLTFVDHPKYYQKALNSDATTIIINKEVDCPEGKALILSENPFNDYVSLVKRFRSFESSNKLISDSAIIGEDTIIQPNCFIGNNVTIGKKCIIHSSVSIYDHSVIGDNVIIHSNSVIGADAFYFQRKEDGYHKMESCGRAVIENNVEIGACSTVDKGVSSDTIIGEGTKMDNHIQVGHDTVIGKNCIIATAVAIAGVITIEDDVTIWGQVAIQKDLTIGKGAVVLGASAVGNDLEAGKVYFGVPAIEAREKWREIASMKRFPELLKKMK